MHGAGDAVIGINPASDNLANCQALLVALDEMRQAFAIPTQSSRLIVIITRNTRINSIMRITCRIYHNSLKKLTNH
ncbi:ethanolamine ammonia-lyase subunit EutB [Paracoccus mutanolyticus]|uniref:ethanolamine ammonia-lyase subunit EutB n=1 Tax=Paracoccus mutanolyticus TaxID=1499308 RepID=UPI0021D538C1|nr:ethanolamine ammonia-lyase subunit EutB [Paracoccus mutanolyticus]